MERYSAAAQPEGLVCPPPPVAEWYREQVAPAISGVPPAACSATILYERDPLTPQPARPTDPEPDLSDYLITAHPPTATHILAKICAPYDAGYQQLAGMLKRLQRPTPPQSQSLDEGEVDGAVVPLTTYPTAFGVFTFPELYARSRPYAAYVLYHRFHLPPQDIEDGLQAGGLTLWQHMQQEPDTLQDKNLTWVGMKVVYSALHASRRDWQYRQQIQDEGGEGSQSGWGTHSPESRQVDKRTDIQRAIATVAERILREEKRKRQQHDLWALYSLTMLQVGSGELSRLFGVREQSMGKANARVRQWLQAALPNYAPVGATRPFRQHGPAALPKPDMQTVRKANEDVPQAVLGVVQTRLEHLNADTRTTDELALEGIRQGIPALTQARTHAIPQWRMQRAYQRVHLMIAAERDPTVRVPRPERRVKPVFALTAESEAAVQHLARELLEQPRSYEKLVALHAHIGNLGISTTAKHFNVPTSTLRYYSQQIGRRLQTPTYPARASGPEQRHQEGPPQPEGVIYSWDSAAD